MFEILNLDVEVLDIMNTEALKNSQEKNSVVNYFALLLLQNFNNAFLCCDFGFCTCRL